MKKEEPNTRNITVWPQGSIPETERKIIRRKRNSDSDSDRTAKFKSLEGRGGTSWWTEKYEFTLLFFMGSLLWVWVVQIVLKFLKFPVHKHTIEVYMFYTIPVIIMYFILYLLDWMFSLKKPAEQDQRARVGTEEEEESKSSIIPSAS